MDWSGVNEWGMGKIGSQWIGAILLQADEVAYTGLVTVYAFQMIYDLPVSTASLGY